MRVKAIMMPFSKLACISVENTVEEAMKIIDEQGLLSLPVVDGQQFVGVLSKQFLFEEFFRNYTGTREEFAQRKVMEFMKTRIETSVRIHGLRKRQQCLSPPKFVLFRSRTSRTSCLES